MNGYDLSCYNAYVENHVLFYHNITKQLNINLKEKNKTFTHQG